LKVIDINDKDWHRSVEKEVSYTIQAAKVVLMRSFILFCLFFSFTTGPVWAESLKKPYFSATRPGTWAKYESSWKQPKGMTGTNIYTYIRASDNADRVRIEIDTETLSGPGKGMTSRQLNVMEPGFDLAMNFLNYMMFLEASVAQTGKGKPGVTQDNMIEAMRKAGGDFTNSVTFKGKADMQSRKCDHYAYSYKSGGPHVTIHEGEIWLDETVPFGVVFKKGKVMDASGKLLSTFEETLLDSGAGESGTAVLLAMTPKTKKGAPEKAAPKPLKSLSLLKAYQSEKIRLLVEVKKGSGGKHLILMALNKTKDPFDIVVPKGPLTIAANSPLQELRLVVDKEQRFSLPPKGTSPPFSARQSGKRGAIEGKFKLTVYEGKPLFMGSVTMGPLK